ncbi:fluoride efflux transporter FluC [Alloscardovia venturai]|uniref:Fluoride-specific ion channel FluC n=1 Tax=Alloscardovia venturai TaxID=1769421 RepID=A0ABW2Y2H9_9BIFI
MSRHSRHAAHSRSMCSTARMHRLRNEVKKRDVNPLTNFWIYVVVFIGGCVGTAGRYGLGLWLNPLERPLGIHWGTFAANTAACFMYACLVSFLTRFHAGRARELANRGLGMGLCGGLSTMSTFVNEIIGTQFSMTYLIISLCAGLFAAAFGSWIGLLGVSAPSGADSVANATGMSNASGAGSVSALNVSRETSESAVRIRAHSRSRTRARRRRH